MTKKVRIGEIIEIPTKKGLAYAQFSHEDKTPPYMGEVIRVLPGFFQERPVDFTSIANFKELYYTFFPVRGAVNRKIFEIAGYADIPSRAEKFPLFRSAQINPKTGKYHDDWWLWDGVKSWRIGKLTDAQLDLSFKCIWNDLLLISNIELGWTPRSAEAFIQAARLKKAILKTPELKGIRHFLLFQSKEFAENAKKLTEVAGFKCEIIDSGPEQKILLLVFQAPPLLEEYTEAITRQLIEIAAESNGQYDAWEAAF